MTVTNPIETIRIGENGRNQLLLLKKRTGIKNWNVLCRWALCKSLAEPSLPPPLNETNESGVSSETTQKPLSVEMTWTTFGGSDADLYSTLLAARCVADNLPLDKETLAEQFRLHLHRGLSFLVGPNGPRSLEDLFEIEVEQG